MSYVKTVWVDDSAPPVNAANLNKIEQGIYDAHTLKLDAPLAAGVDGQFIKRVAGVPAWADVVSATTVATTVAGLGTGTDGKVGMIRPDGTNEDIFVVYNSALAKWVSPAWAICDTQNGNYGTAYDYVRFTPGGPGADVIMVGPSFRYAPLYTAGLRLQVRLSGWFNASVTASTAAQWGVDFYTGPNFGASGGRSSAGQLLSVCDITNQTPGTVFHGRDGGWVTQSSITSGDIIAAGVKMQHGAGMDTYWMGKLEGRWVG